MVCCLRFPPLLVYYCERFSRNVSFSLSLSLSHSVITLSFILILILIPRCVTLHLRKTSLLVEDSCCRGGIVHIRFGCSCALFERASESHGALAVSCKYFKQSKWPFWPHFHTHLRYIHQTYARQDIRVCEDDHVEPPIGSIESQGALTSSRKYLSHSR